jgi:uncharacterized membrane protein
MSSLMRTTLAALLAAGSMYWLDPASGRRRRSLLRGRVARAARCTRHGLDVGLRDLAHRLLGMVARISSSLAAGATSDDVLNERIRSALGRAVSHPRSIEVSSKDGAVVLTGIVLEHEQARLRRAVRAVRGVKQMEDRVTAYKSADHISALQGGRHLPSRNPVIPDNWSPAARLLASTAGCALMICGARQRGMIGALATLTGSSLILRSTVNEPFDRLAGRDERQAIHIQKTIHVNAPVTRVFATFAQCDRFPSFMRNVRKVTKHGDGRSHWVLSGPAATVVEWDAEITACQPNEVLAWRTLPGAAVGHAGIIRFCEESGGTRVDMHMTYNPPAGVLGHLVAKLFGADAKSELDQDLMRLKSYLETGVPAHDAARSRYGWTIEHAQPPNSQPAL